MANIKKIIYFWESVLEFSRETKPIVCIYIFIDNISKISLKTSTIETIHSITIYF